MGRTGYTGIRFADNPHRDAAEQDVQDFLQRFASALTSGDIETVVELWQPPAFVLGDPDVHAVSSNEEIRQFFGQAKQHYNAQGITDARPEITNLHWPNERIAIVEVRWPWLDANGREVGDETSTYTLRRNERGELKLRVAVMHGASQPRGTRH